MKVFLITGPTGSGKTELIISEMEKAHRSNPFSYVFVGPTGSYVKTIREAFVNRVGSIVASRFMAIDEFAVTIMKKLRPEMLHISSNIVKSEISDILEEIGRKDLAQSPTFVEYVFDIINDVKENDGFDKIFAQDDEITLLMRSLYSKLSNRFNSNLIYDTFDAYLSLAELSDELHPGEFGETLFIDGFHDFSPAVKAFLEGIVPIFSKVFITAPEDANRCELFAEARTIIDFVEEREGKIDSSGEIITSEKRFLSEQHLPKNLEPFLKTFFSEQKITQSCENVEVIVASDIFNEVEYISREIKRTIKSGYEPGDIAIVASDFSRYEKLFSERLGEYGIPFRSEGDEPLLESRAVKMLLLPFETAVNGFKPEKIVAMGDFGYGGSKLDTKFFESIAIQARLIYDYPTLTLQKRVESWEERLERYKELVQRKIRAVEEISDEEFIEQEISGYREVILRVDEEIEPAIERIFQVLAPFRSLSRRDCRIYREYFYEWSELIRIEERYRKLVEESEEEPFRKLEGERELLALKRFFNDVLPALEELLLFLGKERISPADYHRYLMLILRNTSFKSSRAIENRVEIQSLLNARFSRKKIKFFVGFNDGYYPMIRMNPLYSFTQYDEKAPKDLLLVKEKQQKLNLYLAVTRTSDRLYFSYPESTIDGEPLLPSAYLQDVIKSAGVTPERVGQKEGRKVDIIPELETVMSEKELKIAVASHFNTRHWEMLKDKLGMDNLEKVLQGFNREFTWIISDRKKIEDHIGKVFSFSRLQSYHKCPFSFYLAYILKIQTPEEGLFELTPLEEGNVYHNVLKDYFSKSALDWEKSLEENMRKYIRHDSELVFKFEYERLRRVIAEYIQIKESKKLPKVEGEFEPTYFELGFGMGNQKPVKILEDAYIRGKIDRIDVDKDTGAMYIMDYKRGNSGEKEQLILYSIAANKLLKEKGYFVVGDSFRPLSGSTNFKDSFVVVTDEGKDIWKFSKSKFTREDIENWVKEKTEGIFNGVYIPKIIENRSGCYNCSFAKLKICSVILWRKEE